MRSYNLLTAAVACICLVGCANSPVSNVSAISDGGASPSASPTIAPTVTASVEPAGTPRPDEARENKQERFNGTAGVTDKESRAEQVAILTAIRIGQHSDHDRIVFEFSGPSLPGYHIEYIDKPVRSCGSGEVVPLAGDGWLEIRMSPAAAHTEQGQPTIKTRAFTLNLPAVRELKSTCDFEADVTWVAGVSSPNKYRVLELIDPVRLVVDISH